MQARTIPSLDDIRTARARISGTAIETPLIPSALSEADPPTVDREVLLKLETVQPIGAFKLRGAANALSALDAADRGRGVVCCSTGNHGRGVAYVARALGIRAVVCLSTLVPDAKVRAIAALGAEVRRAGRSQDEAETEAGRLVAEEGLTYISPFDDPFVIAGQGGIGLELMEARPDLEAIVVPLSGGGLIAGIALAAKALKPSVRIVGVSMDRGAAMAASLKAGHPVAVEEYASLADSLGGGIGLSNRSTFAVCRDFVDEIVLVTEADIYCGMRSMFYDERMVAEGAASVAHAAVLAGKLTLDGPSAFVVTGRNVDMSQFAAVVRGDPVQLGDVTVGSDISHAPREKN